MTPEILYTPRYEDDLVRIYKYSARKWGRSVDDVVIPLCQATCRLRTMTQLTTLRHFVRSRGIWKTRG